MLGNNQRLGWLWSIILATCWTVWPATAQVKRPNVVLILIDDLNHYGVTAYGANRISEWSGKFTNRVFSTPCIDRLATRACAVTVSIPV